MELLMGGSSSTESSSLTTGIIRYGQKIYLEDGSGSRLSKNRGHKSTTARCQVEGCKMDLSCAKRYYSRHKVCFIHSKSSKVIVSGLLQRFCQQCSRFHQLCEFDLEKRSCRRRLACHNERRRKPQAPTTGTLLACGYSRITRSPYGSVLGDPTTWSTARDSHQLMNVTWPEIMNNNCTDTSCVLSLLSNSNTIEQQQQLQTSTNASLRVTMAQSPPVSVHSQYLNQTWEFMSGEMSNSPCVSPVLGPSQQISEPDELQFLMTNGNTMGGFELNIQQHVLRQYLEPDSSRAYDSSTQHFTWSL